MRPEQLDLSPPGAPLTPRATAASASAAARFDSILFPGGGPQERFDAPACFHDLNLDQIVTAITAGRQAYRLEPFFHAAQQDIDTIGYRQEVMRDLQTKPLMQAVKAWAAQMLAMRVQLELANKAHHRHEKARWFLAAAALYGQAVLDLTLGLRNAAPVSRGLLALRAWLVGHVESVPFITRMAQVRTLEADLAAIRYTLLIKGLTITVRAFDGEIDEAAAVENVFEKFKRGAVKDYRAKFRNGPGLNHVEAQVLDRVALLNPDTFRALDVFCTQHRDFAEVTLTRFDREIQFYVACIEFVGGMQTAGLPFCYPVLAADGADAKAIDCRGAFDLALACKLVPQKTQVVRNDFFLRGAERIFVVSGPNQGGKTTFARTVGQLHFLARLGCPVPGTFARLYLCDEIYCHFERAENIDNLHGKLYDDLLRVHQILERATPRSLVILNEIFSSTSLQDAVKLGRKVMARISQLDLLCVCVTFLDELASFDEKTVSLVSKVDAQQPAVRTYKVERRPADGLSHAVAIAEKYGLTYAQLTQRIAP
jgi:hypothetical protein